MLPTQDKGSLNLDTMQEAAISLVDLVCSVICRPVELVLRPWHGTRYFPPAVVFGSSVLMIIWPAFTAVGNAMVGMIPFSHIAPPAGMFSSADFSELYFLLSFIHGVRIYRRMIRPELEEHSEYEGGSLPFIHLIPFSNSFISTRVLIEPALLFLAASLLQTAYIIQSNLSAYLHFAAFALAMKQFISWYRSWEFIRKILDARAAGPIIAKLIENKATQEDLAPIHLANFPKDVAPEIRTTAAHFIARAFDIPTGGNNGTH